MIPELSPERKRRKRQHSGSSEDAGVNAESITIKVDRSGDWMPAEDLRTELLTSVKKGRDISIDLDGIAHLDASALQILLATQAEQRIQSRRLDFLNASAEVRAWFDYAGAANHLVF